MENLVPFIGLFLLAVVCGIYAGCVAGEKGHDWLNWTVGGFFLGPLALVAAAGLPDRTLRRYIRLLAEKQGVEVEPKSLGLTGPEYKDH